MKNSKAAGASDCHAPQHSAPAADGKVDHSEKPLSGDGDRAKLIARLKRIEGQVRGVQRMVAEEEYCIDVLTQIAALQSALKGVGLVLLEEHMAHCVVQAARTSDQAVEEKLEEVSQAIARFTR